jgi:ubiquinone/menaquinone biosynthesis C-methylase UbiE
MADTRGRGSTYAHGNGEEETRRQILMAHQFDLPLRRLFEDAGIGRGMRVLDVGSGAGDVALLVAEMVGPGGEVVGVEIDAARVEAARERARAAGVGNVAFVAGDLRGGMELEGEFDAIVGRLILIHVADPAAVLRALVRYLRPGGLVAFQETDTSLWYLDPPVPLVEKMRDWINRAVAASGANNALGLKLPRVFAEAGLVKPRLRVHGDVTCDPDDPSSYVGMVPTFRTLVPAILEAGIATAEEIEIETFAERLRSEMASRRAVFLFSLMVDAWARKP